VHTLVFPVLSFWQCPDIEDGLTEGRVRRSLGSALIAARTVWLGNSIVQVRTEDPLGLT
jgi:hypothetical protein